MDHRRIDVRGHLKGFALLELAASLVIFGILAALLTVVADRSRALSSLGESQSNLRKIGASMAAYGADNADALPSFTWRENAIGPCRYPDLIAQAQGGRLEPLAAQAVDILRRRTGRETFPQINGWMPGLLYSHLVLVDYEASSLPARWAVSPADANRTLWSRDPAGFEAGRYDPSPYPLSPRWPYSSSYEWSTVLGAFDYANGDHGCIAQANAHNLWTYLATPGSGLTIRHSPEIVYPSHKAVVWDSSQRHFGRELYFLFPEARVPLLFADGGVRVRSTIASGRGFQPDFPRSAFPSSITYAPGTWEPPPPASNPQPSVYGQYRFTRSGLLGRDFDGDEVPVP